MACFNIGEGKCRYPVKCNCTEPYGGFDCASDLSDIPNFTIDKQCCDLRHEKCDKINLYGYPFSKVNKVYTKFQLIETRNSIPTIIFEDIVVGTTISNNNVQVEISNLEMFNLYKNIHGLNKFNDDSLATVYVSISYIQTKFKQNNKMVLYDSKCIDCNYNVKPVSNILSLMY